MEKLVVVYMQTDGCTYSCEVTKPVLYESTASFYVEFFDVIKNFLVSQDVSGFSQDGTFMFADKMFSYSDFFEKLDHDQSGLDFYKNNTSVVFSKRFNAHYYICMPDVYELDSWFQEKYQEN